MMRTAADEAEMKNGWIAVDLDGTLAYYDHWRGVEHIGEPVPAMQARVKRWLAQGRDVRIFTARVAGHVNKESDARRYIAAWCKKHLDVVLPVTCQKDMGMVELWDDRCVQIVPNTGRTIADELESVWSARQGKAPPAAE